MLELPVTAAARLHLIPTVVFDGTNGLANRRRHACILFSPGVRSAAPRTALFGTDLGAGAPDPSEEYALMAAAGMSTREILASLTTAPAKHFGESHFLGRISEGFQADLVVVKDLRTLSDVRYTVRSGKVIYRGAA